MKANMKIKIFTVGGTIDKVYFDKRSKYEVGEPQIGEILKEANVIFEYDLESILKKDSLELTDDDRQLIYDRIESDKNPHILVTHGTDTVIETAKKLQNIPNKVIVLTGAIEPARSKSSDAPFNAGSAVAALQLLPPGVYLAINGRIFDPNKVKKNMELNRFEETWKEVNDEDLADMMIYLQEIGCHRINLVTPTHVMPNILKATRTAFKKGLRIALVYNTSGYERVEILKILDGIVDIYLPDMKYMDTEKAAKYSAGASDYPQMAKKAIVEMNRQVGEHSVKGRGIATRGLMIRHLVMPNRVAGTRRFAKWVAETLPKSTYVNIMHQYRVEYKAYEHAEIWRAITVDEYVEAMNWAVEYGLTNLDPRSVAVYNVYVREQDSRLRIGRQEGWGALYVSTSRFRISAF